VQVAIGELLAEWLDSVGDSNRLLLDGRFVALVTIAAAPVPLLLVWYAVRRAHCTLQDYLGLNSPQRRDIALGLLALAVLIPLIDLISYLAGHAVTPKFVTDLYTSSRDSSSLWLLALALVVAAPLVEEIVFRGFLLPGLAASRLRPGGALLFTSILWALLHGQYQPFYLAQIVVLGIVFGWLRVRSGTTTLTVGLHATVNLVSLVQAAVIVEWLA
jgi:membrane protease YdiL (CAAX protease family)